MKGLPLASTFTAALAMVFLFAGAEYEAGRAYFTRTRSVVVTFPDRQNYLVVDAAIWKFARPDLGDLRLYDGSSQVPYALITERGGSSSQQSAAKILNLGKVGDHTEFDLEVGDVQEYSRMRLQLEAKNFINIANLQVRKSANDRSGTDLGTSTLYDFTAEGLGSNSTLKFPPSLYIYSSRRVFFRPKSRAPTFQISPKLRLPGRRLGTVVKWPERRSKTFSTASFSMACQSTELLLTCLQARSISIVG